MDVAVTNLLDNALKHAPEGRRAGRDPATCWAQARATRHRPGPGIPAEDRKRIFERFVRGKAATEARVRAAASGSRWSRASPKPMRQDLGGTGQTHRQHVRAERQGVGAKLRNPRPAPADDRACRPGSLPRPGSPVRHPRGGSHAGHDHRAPSGAAAELGRQDSELGRTYRTLTELAGVTLRVSEADLRAIAEATAPCPLPPPPRRALARRALLITPTGEFTMTDPSVSSTSGVVPNFISDGTEAAVNLTPEGLMLYLESRLDDVDTQINGLFKKQQDISRIRDDLNAIQKALQTLENDPAKKDAQGALDTDSNHNSKIDPNEYADYEKKITDAIADIKEVDPVLGESSSPNSPGTAISCTTSMAST